jgi:hypothetical protein
MISQRNIFKRYERREGPGWCHAALRPHRPPNGDSGLLQPPFETKFTLGERGLQIDVVHAAMLRTTCATSPERNNVLDGAQAR